MSANDKYRSVYKRVETDAEFRARVFPGFTYVAVYPPERRKNERALAYRHRVRRTGEGDYEFERRLKYGEAVRVDSLTSEQLDDAAWRACKLQRKLVEDVTR